MGVCGPRVLIVKGGRGLPASVPDSKRFGPYHKENDNNTGMKGKRKGTEVRRKKRIVENQTTFNLEQGDLPSDSPDYVSESRSAISVYCYGYEELKKSKKLGA